MSTTNDDAASIYAAEVVRHTAEPWKAEASNRIVSTDTGWGIGECFVTTAQPLPLASANAARIVACVNACAGMEDPEKAISKALLALNDAKRRLMNHSVSGLEEASADSAVWDSIKSALRALGGQP